MGEWVESVISLLVPCRYRTHDCPGVAWYQDQLWRCCCTCHLEEYEEELACNS